MTLTDAIIQRIIVKLLHGDDYRIEIITLIDSEFMDYAIRFLKRVAMARFDNQTITEDWYKAEFLNSSLPADEVIIHSGLNRKTISNMYNSATREVVIVASSEHYDQLYQMIHNLIEQGEDIDLTLTIRFNGVSVDLTLSESLIVINTLAVKRAALRGGAWSTVGKQVEKLLMLALCRLYSVSKENYKLAGKTDQSREVDFYLISPDGLLHACEVKLMGKGNPESADAVIARDSSIFVADKLSDLNKTQFTQRRVKWVELRSENSHLQFATILNELKIPHSVPQGDVDHHLQMVLDELFSNEK
jgi:hypothetical protein